ncbi:MAG: FkbM family methyltransferase [Opitutaceae bacterium]|nr:FkbM family methyltransferase [Verrucomicrobiales bacterium]
MNLRSLVKYVFRRDTTHHGEFSLMLKLAGRECPRVIVDVGANDGYYGSNSFPFVARRWRAVLIEPHPVAFARLQKLHTGRPNVTCLNVACSDVAGTLPLWMGTDGDAGTMSTLSTDDHPHFQKVRTNQSVPVVVERLETILARLEIPPEFGILSIDTEGLDCEVLLGLHLNIWRPRLIVTEDFGPKDSKKALYLEGRDYRLAGKIAANSFWTPVDR